MIKKLALFSVASLISSGVSSPLKGSPDTLDDPMALRKYLPRLKEQKLWTEFASPAEQKLYQGEWKTGSPSILKTLI